MTVTVKRKVVTCKVKPPNILFNISTGITAYHTVRRFKYHYHLGLPYLIWNHRKLAQATSVNSLQWYFHIFIFPVTTYQTVAKNQLRESISYVHEIVFWQSATYENKLKSCFNCCTQFTSTSIGKPFESHTYTVCLCLRGITSVKENTFLKKVIHLGLCLCLCLC